MNSRRIFLNFKVLNFFLLSFTFCTSESDLVNQPNEGALETTKPNIPGEEILKGIEGNTVDKRFIDEESYKIVSVITKEMIPQLFERFQHPKLSFAKETWKPKNCEKNKFWSILLVFDKRRDVEPPDAATLTMMLDDVFKIYRNISRVEYDFSRAVVERESVKILICFQNVHAISDQSTQTDFEGDKPSQDEGINSVSVYKPSTPSPAGGCTTATEREFVQKVIKDEVIAIFKTFYPRFKTESKIIQEKHELDGACSTLIFDISFEVHGARHCGEIKKLVDKMLQKLPEWYTHIVAACLLESGETESENMLTTIRLKVSKLKDKCKISKGVQKELCPGVNSTYKYITTEAPITESIGYYKDPEMEYVKKVIKKEISPNIEAFCSECAVSYEIAHQGTEYGINCPIEIFDIYFNVRGGYFHPKLIVYLNKLLDRLPERYECYTYLLAACLLKSSETTSKDMFIKIRLKVSKIDDTCKISKGGSKILCK